MHLGPLCFQRREVPKAQMLLGILDVSFQNTTQPFKCLNLTTEKGNKKLTKQKTTTCPIKQNLQLPRHKSLAYNHITWTEKKKCIAHLHSLKQDSLREVTTKKEQIPATFSWKAVASSYKTIIIFYYTSRRNLSPLEPGILRFSLWHCTPFPVTLIIIHIIKDSLRDQ